MLLNYLVPLILTHSNIHQNPNDLDEISLEMSNRFAPGDTMRSQQTGAKNISSGSTASGRASASIVAPISIRWQNEYTLISQDMVYTVLIEPDGSKIVLFQ